VFKDYAAKTIDADIQEDQPTKGNKMLLYEIDKK
jgi:hypothetical protein